jgi:hypothetical protein
MADSRDLIPDTLQRYAMFGKGDVVLRGDDMFTDRARWCADADVSALEARLAAANAQIATLRTRLCSGLRCYVREEYDFGNHDDPCPLRTAYVATRLRPTAAGGAAQAETRA